MPKRRFDWAALRRPGPAGAAGYVGANPDEAPADPEPRSNAVGAPAPLDLLSGPPVHVPALAGSPPSGIEIRVNDLKQFTYCPRIVFYQYAMPVEHRATFKMERGKTIEVRVEDLEKRRRLREYGLDAGTRRFQVWMRSPRLGLSGRVDLLIETADGMFPVDFKDTTAPIRHNHRVQLCAYAILIEETFRRPVRVGFIYRVPRSDVAEVEMSLELRTETEETIQAIRTLIRSECMPEATPVRARCTDCEYRNYCGDVF